ncbi:MAG: glycogen/starch/alpha-glucan phosphorylase [Candidatus Izemoplasmatales bacterium]|jgi:starch phosphorylase
MTTRPFQSTETFIACFQEQLAKTYLVDPTHSSIRQRYNVLGTLVKEALASDWIKTNQQLALGKQKEVYYFSMEFLMGRLITNNINNLGVRSIAEAGFSKLGFDLNEVENYEPDPGLGNGGLGRLAACYLDSMASLKVAGFGNCIRYRYGLFRQVIKNGYQEERPDNWLSDGYVWEIRKEEECEDVPFFGSVEIINGKAVYRPSGFVKAVPYDVPVVGDGNGFVTCLRLWSAEASRKYPKNRTAMDYEMDLQKLSGFLYPDDTTLDGKQVRLMQQYFFSCAGVKSICHKHKAKYNTLDNLAEKVVFHINDTHPTLIIPELMRFLLDDEGYEWDQAWAIVTHSMAYTNHTILAEALEKWPIGVIQPVLPRIYQIIEEINQKFCDQLRKQYQAREELIQKLAIIANGVVQMAHLCIVACYSVNGVAKLHTEILKTMEMNDFYRLYPDKFHNVTNGITHRRWLIHSNPELTAILDDSIGDSWHKHPEDLIKFAAYADDHRIIDRLLAMKKTRKTILAERIYQDRQFVIDPDAIFDIQVKRLHEYKRQLLNALHIMDLYNHLKTDLDFRKNYFPHVFIFGAKAAGTYYFAKKIIKLINTIANKVNADSETNSFLKVVFVENYNVSYAEKIMPAADISEQISTASKEASGTGNMKFMMNGGLTIGTEDGANVEIHELVGDDNIFIFGMTAHEVTNLTKEKTYHSEDIINTDDDLSLVLKQLVNGFFTEVDSLEFRDIYEKLLYDDCFFVLKDFAAYKHAHLLANDTYKDRYRWGQRMVINIANSGVFSSDRAIMEYVNTIWHL